MKKEEFIRIRGEVAYEKMLQQASEWHKDHPEKVKAIHRTWMNRNPGKAAEHHRKWKAQNIEKSREDDRKRRRDHPEEMGKAYRKYRKTEKGKEMVRKNRAKRRGFGFIKLNEPFPGCEGHHLDKEFVVHIPKEMHKSIFHSVLQDINMEEINALALDYVYGD